MSTPAIFVEFGSTKSRKEAMFGLPVFFRGASPSVTRWRFCGQNPVRGENSAGNSAAPRGTLKKTACVLLLTSAVADLAQAQDNFPVAAVNNDLTIRNGDLIIRDNANRIRTRLDSGGDGWRAIGQGGRTVVHINQRGANIFAGGNGSGQDGDLVLFSENASNQKTNNASLHFDGGAGAARIGGGGEHGRLVMRNAQREQNIFLDGEKAHLIVGNDGNQGTFFVRNGSGTNTTIIEGATGRVRAQQMISRHQATGTADGIDSASVYIVSRDPALAFRDNTNGNNKGWYIQSSSEGRLIFSAGTTDSLASRAFVLGQDGSICLGACD